MRKIKHSYIWASRITSETKEMFDTIFIISYESSVQRLSKLIYTKFVGSFEIKFHVQFIKC